MCDWKREAIESGFPASFFEPAGVLVRECDDDQFIGWEGAKRIRDRLHWVGVTDPGLNVVGRCRVCKPESYQGREWAGALADLGVRIR